MSERRASSMHSTEDGTDRLVASANREVDSLIFFGRMSTVGN